MRTTMHNIYTPWPFSDFCPMLMICSRDVLTLSEELLRPPLLSFWNTLYSTDSLFSELFNTNEGHVLRCLRLLMGGFWKVSSEQATGKLSRNIEQSKTSYSSVLNAITAIVIQNYVNESEQGASG